jgi:hypothetical protein
MRWELSDGTEVHLGGRVRGTSELAKAIRADVLAARGGHLVPVQVEAPPSKPRRLDLDDAQLVHEWLLAACVRADATVSSAPELEPIERFNPLEPDGAPELPIH